MTWMMAVYLFACVMVGATAHLWWPLIKKQLLPIRTSDAIRARLRDDDLDEILGREEHDLILEFHRARIFLPEEIARARVGRESLFAREQCLQAESMRNLAVQDLQRHLSQAQFQGALLRPPQDQQRNMNRGLLSGLGGGIGGIFGGLGGAFGQALTKGGPARLGDREYVPIHSIVSPTIGGDDE